MASHFELQEKTKPPKRIASAVLIVEINGALQRPDRGIRQSPLCLTLAGTLERNAGEINVTKPLMHHV